MDVWELESGTLVGRIRATNWDIFSAETWIKFLEWRGPFGEPRLPERKTDRQLIVRETVVLWVSDPDEPFRVRVCAPRLAFLPTVTVTVACAELVPLRVT